MIATEGLENHVGSANCAQCSSAAQIRDYIVSDRNGIIENRYAVHAAIVDAKGDLLYTVGDPTRMTLSRSAAKPAQALAILETGACEHFGFDDAEIALMCASHNGENMHVDKARRMLAKIGATEGDLKCGGHPSISDLVNRSWIKSDFEPTSVYSNCSGKHSGMLAGAKMLDAGFDGYHLPDLPMQVRVRQVFEDLSDQRDENLRWGVDGCNLPAPASPLHSLARVYAFFADCADIVGASGEKVSHRVQRGARIFKAMSQYPEYVAGDGRFCTDLMRVYKGAVVGKLGADGCYGVAIRESERTRSLSANGALGIAVKIEDGNINILYSAVVGLLEQLGLYTPDAQKELSKYTRQKILNTAGIVTGHISHQFQVRKLQ